MENDAFPVLQNLTQDKVSIYYMYVYIYAYVYAYTHANFTLRVNTIIFL